MHGGREQRDTEIRHRDVKPPVLEPRERARIHDGPGDAVSPTRGYGHGVYDGDHIGGIIDSGDGGGGEFGKERREEDVGAAGVVEDF